MYKISVDKGATRLLKRACIEGWEASQPLCNMGDMFKNSLVFASCLGDIPPRYCAALECQIYATFFLILFLSHHRVWSGDGAERFTPSDALCGAAEGGASALLVSSRFLNPIGPQRTVGVRGDHDERKKETREKTKQTLKTPD